MRMNNPVEFSALRATKTAQVRDGWEGEGQGCDWGGDDGEEEGAGEEAREGVEPQGDGTLVPQR